MLKCIQSFLIKKGIKSIDKINLKEPIFRAATIEQIQDQITKAWSHETTKSEKVYLKWIGDGEIFNPFGESNQPEWVPVEELLYKNLNFSGVRAGRSFIIYSDIEMWQVLFTSTSRTMEYMIKPMVSAGPQRWFTYDTSKVIHMRDVSDCGSAVTSPKSVTGSVSSTVASILLKQEKLEIPEDEKPLHQQILKLMSRGYV